MTTENALYNDKYPQLDEIIKNMARKKGLTEESVIKEAVIDKVLPQDKNARQFILDIYGENGSIGKSLEKLYSYNACGIYGASIHNNLKDIVLYTYAKAKTTNTCLRGNEPDRYHARDQIRSIARILRNENEKDYTKQVDACETLQQELDETPDKVDMVNAYEIITGAWDVLCNKTETYRLLMDLVIMDKDMYGKNFTDDDKFELYELICHAADEWDKQDK